MKLFQMTALYCVAWLIAENSSASAGKNSPEPGDTPPLLALSTVVQGPSLSEVDWAKLKGKVVVLEFWGTRCGPCLKAIPHWNQLAAQFRSKPVVFLSVSDDNKDDLAVFLKRTPIQGWVAVDQPFSPTRAAFDVVSIPHTVIVGPAGRIAAITHPTQLNARNLEEILDGKPTSLPAFVPYEQNAGDGTLAVSNLVPATVEVSIEGPFPQPNGAFDSRGWRKPDYQFNATKAYLRDALASVFDISPLLVMQKGNVPDGLYNISASAPPDKLPDLQASLIAAIKAKLGLIVITNLQPVEVYTLTVCPSNAPCLKPAQKGGGGGSRPGGFYGNGVRMEGIAASLEGPLQKPVIDQSGLIGRWNVDFKWEMSEGELLERRLSHKYYAILDSDPDKIDLAHLPQDLQKQLSADELEFLKTELAKPVEQRFRPDAAKVIEAARDQLGLDLKLTNRNMRTILIHATPSSESLR